MTKEQKQIITRLLRCAETTVAICENALSPNPADFDVKVALLIANNLDIKYNKDEEDNED